MNPARVIPITEDDQAEIERRRRECSRRDGYQAALDALRKGQDREAAWVALVAACAAAGVVFEDTDLEAILTAAAQVVDHEKAQADAPVERKLSPRDEFLAAQKAAFAYLDAHHAVVTQGSQAGILNETSDGHGGVSFALLKEREFGLTYRHLQGVRPPESGEKTGGRVVSFASAWLARPETRRYRGIEFCPPPAKCPPSVYNTWRGWPFEGTAPGSCEKFLCHLENIVCGGDLRLFGWLISWLADLVQAPGLSPKGTAVVLRGERGTGKTIVMDTVGKLFGTAYTLVSSADEFLTRFNGSLENTLFLGCDEGVWGGDKKHESVLKSLITGDRRQSESKFLDAKQVSNRVRLMIASNEDWTIPAGPFERRFLALDVKPDHRGDRPYFVAIKKELEADGGAGYAALFHYLRGYRIPECVNLRKPPETAALASQKIRSLDGFGQWWADCLDSGSIGLLGWPASIAKQDFYAKYLDDARARGSRHLLSQIQVGLALGRFCPGCGSVQERDGDRRYRAYRLPDLAEARHQFEKSLGSEGQIKWTEEA